MSREVAETDVRTMKREAGISLIEVLITIFILAMVCITLISVFIYGFNLLAKTKQTALATQVAQFEVERYRNMNFDAIPILSEPFALGGKKFLEDLNASDQLSPYRFLLNKDGEPYLVNGRLFTNIELGSSIGMDENIKKVTVTVMWDYRNKRYSSGGPFDSGSVMRKDVVTYFSSSGINRR